MATLNSLEKEWGFYRYFLSVLKVDYSAGGVGFLLLNPRIIQPNTRRKIPPKKNGK